MIRRRFSQLCIGDVIMQGKWGSQKIYKCVIIGITPVGKHLIDFDVICIDRESGSTFTDSFRKEGPEETILIH